MTTDRTQPARPAAPNDRSSAPAERRDGSAFAALLDAHAPAPDAARDERAPEPRDGGARHDEAPGHEQPAPRDGGTGHELSRDAARHDLHTVRHDLLAAAPQAAAALPQAATALTAAPPAVEAAPASTGQPVVVPPFVATVSAEAPVATPAAPAGPLFMLAPEAIAAVPAIAAPLGPQAVAPAPAAPPVVAPAAVAEPAQGEAAAPLQPQVPQAPAPAQPAAPEGELPAEPAAEAPASEPHVATPARAAATAEPAPAAAPTPVAEPVAEPVAPAPVSSTPVSAPERTTPLHRAPAAVATFLHVAVDRGITHAKMALRPAELGGIEIRLQATAGGVAAQVVADSPEAARLLAQAGDDLRRALEARDVTLISLEVSTSSDQRQRESARGEWNETAPTYSGRAPASEGDDEPAPTPTQTVIELPGGLLVDVLA